MLNGKTICFNSTYMWMDRVSCMLDFYNQHAYIDYHNSDLTWEKWFSIFFVFTVLFNLMESICVPGKMNILSDKKYFRYFGLYIFSIMELIKTLPSSSCESRLPKVAFTKTPRSTSIQTTFMFLSPRQYGYYPFNLILEISLYQK